MIGMEEEEEEKSSRNTTNKMFLRLPTITNNTISSTMSSKSGNSDDGFPTPSSDSPNRYKIILTTSTSNHLNAKFYTALFLKNPCFFYLFIRQITEWETRPRNMPSDDNVNDVVDQRAMVIWLVYFTHSSKFLFVVILIGVM